jgi:hypothetical protein
MKKKRKTKAKKLTPFQEAVRAAGRIEAVVVPADYWDRLFALLSALEAASAHQPHYGLNDELARQLLVFRSDAVALRIGGQR